MACALHGPVAAATAYESHHSAKDGKIMLSVPHKALTNGQTGDVRTNSATKPGRGTARKVELRTLGVFCFPVNETAETRKGML